MKKWKRMLVLLLALAMTLTTLAACSSSESSSSSTDSTSETTTDDDSAADETEESTSDVWEGEVAEINIYVMDIYGISENAQSVVDAMNAITETSIGVIANITYISMGDYDSKLSLAISGGEQVDLCMIAPTDSTNFTSMYANGQLMDITAYMEDEGAEMLELIGDYIDAYTVEGSIYGAPAYRNYSSSIYIVMRKDMLEELDMVEFAENMTTWSEYEEILAAVAENYDISPIVGQQQISYRQGAIFGSDSFADTVTFDALSDDLNLIYTDDDGNISLLQENEDYVAALERVRTWYENGWVYEDSIVTTESGDSLMKAGVAFSQITVSEIGVEASKEEACGYEVVCVEVCKLVVSSSEVNKFGFAVPVTAEEPEAAVRWMNALYTSAELSNLLIWGIEGEDYVVEDGEAVYPEGLDSSTVNYHTADFLYGNFFLAYPWDGSGSDFREVAYETLMEAPVSTYLGFTVDQTDMTNVIAALTSVVTKYEASILCGAYTDADLEDYISSLKTAGVEEYIELYQEQLDAWLAAN